MVEIYEITDSGKIKDACKKFKQRQGEFERYFIMEDVEETGLGVLALENGKVKIKTIYVAEGLPFEYYDLLTRSLLNIVRNMNPIDVVIYTQNKYFERFGFEYKDGRMQIKSDKIDLSGYCKK